MKKRIAVLLALMIGFAYCPSETVVMAAGNEETSVEADENEEKSQEKNEEKSAESEEKKGNDEKEGSFLNNLLNNFFGGKEEKEDLDESSKKTQRAANKKSAALESSGLKNLQIPQKLNVVIDPWEMDKRGQVYSEEYVISNTGDTPGILTLSGLACRPREQSGVIIRTDKAGIHDSGDKSIYMEMVLGSGERIVFSQESSQYQTELKPGEELSICFTGEVNENAFGQWENNDIAVSVVYSWETEEELNGVASEAPEEENQDDVNAEEIKQEAQDEINSEEESKPDLDAEESIEKTADDSKKEESEEQQPEADELEKDQSVVGDADPSQETFSDSVSEEVKEPETFSNSDDNSIGESLESAMKESLNSDNSLNPAEKEKDEIKNVELQEPQKVDVVIDSWKVDEKGRIVSPQYLLENTGDTTGVWMLSELICKPQEQNTIAIKADKNGLHDSEEKSVFMELVTGKGEKLVLSQEKSQYKLELKPGEKLAVRFVGEMNGNLFENRENGDIAVTAVCTWELK